MDAINEIQRFSTRQRMARSDFEIHHYRNSCLKEVALHHHDFYEIYLFLDGNVQYRVESRTYQLRPRDILLISPLELHQPHIARGKSPYERIVLWINPSYLERFSTPQTDLTRCFDTRLATHTNLLRLPPKPSGRLTGLTEALASATCSRKYGGDILASSYLMQLLVEINREVSHAPPHPEAEDKSGRVMAEILGYINSHYAEPLSLDRLAGRFFISKYYLAHEFNRLVGTSVYRYIIQKRLVIARQMLTGGLTSKQVCRRCGFGDYTNFYRAFKEEYGISPKEFKRGRT